MPKKRKTPKPETILDRFVTFTLTPKNDTHANEFLNNLKAASQQFEVPPEVSFFGTATCSISQDPQYIFKMRAPADMREYVILAQAPTDTEAADMDADTAAFAHRFLTLLVRTSADKLYHAQPDDADPLHVISWEQYPKFIQRVVLSSLPFPCEQVAVLSDDRNTTTYHQPWIQEAMDAYVNHARELELQVQQDPTQSALFQGGSTNGKEPASSEGSGSGDHVAS